jgi:serine/threonine protein phosphatase PrpC
MWVPLLRRFRSEEAKIVFQTAVLSSAGGRLINEDAVGHCVSGDAGCWALADGLGGHRGGEVASRLAVDAVLASFGENPSVTKDALDAHMARANRALFERQAAEPELAQMRTTLVALILSPSAAMWAHAGDSRLYWLRNGKIRGQTKDDSVPQRLVDAGEISPDQIRFHEDRSRLLNSVGARERVIASHCEIASEQGDSFLLASDGFWEYLTETELEQDSVHAKSSQVWIDRMGARVKHRALAGNHADHDNYSAVAVRILKK